MKHHKAERMTQYLSENMNGKLVICLRDISHTMRSLYEGRGSQKRVLMVLNETGTITQRELTARLGIQPGSASEVIAKLENMGLVNRSLSETDRRTADISLTNAGREQAQAALEQRQHRHEEMFSALSEEEKAHLLALLERINNDWESRYQSRRDRHGFHSRPDGKHGCNHDCVHCDHPCGAGRNGQV